MSANKQIKVNVLSVDESAGTKNVQQSSVKINEPPDLKQSNITLTSSMQTVDGESADAPWYILYWIDQYHYLPETTREQIRENVEKSPYFDNFSESIASLLDAEYTKDNSTIPVSDMGTDITGYTYTRVLDYVLTRHVAHLTDEMSVKTNNMFKRNMTFIKDDTGIASKLSTDTHGNNLITDSQHYNRLIQVLDELKQLISEKLGVMNNVLLFIQNNTSAVHFDKWKHRLLTEYSLQMVDIFGNPIDHAGHLRSQSMKRLQPSDLSAKPIALA